MFENQENIPNRLRLSTAVLLVQNSFYSLIYFLWSKTALKDSKATEKQNSQRVQKNAFKLNALQKISPKQFEQMEQA